MKILYCGYNLHHKGYESMSDKIHTISNKVGGRILTLGDLNTKKLFEKKGRTTIINNNFFLKHPNIPKILFILKANLSRSDLVHVINFGPSRWIKYLRKNFIISISESILFDKKNQDIKDDFLRILKTKPQYIICESPSMKKYLLKEGVPFNKLIVVAPGVDLNFFKPRKRAKIKRFSLLFASAPLREGHFYSRGIDILLSAYKKFRLICNSELTLIWRGYGKARIKLMIKDRKKINIIDKKLKDMKKLYLDSSVTIIPYRDVKGNKDIPLSAIESLACGIPVIAPKSSGLNSFGIKRGIIFHDGTTEGIYHALINLKKNYKMHQKSARQITEKYFNLSEELNKLIRIYRKVI